MTQGAGKSLVQLESLWGKSRIKTDGCQKGNVLGSYVHGIFDEENVAATIVDCLLNNKGIDRPVETISFKEYKESQYDLLAQEIRKSVDMGAIYRILEEGV